MQFLETNTKEKLFAFYWKVQKKLVPGLTNSQYCYKRVLKEHLYYNSHWLDLGCGHQLLPEWMPSSQREQAQMASHGEIIIGMDYDITSLKKHKYIKYLVVGDIHNLPFKKNVFHIITANVVVEHIANPEKAFAEVNRILLHNGKFIFHTPNLLNFKIAIAHIIPQKIRCHITKFLEGREDEDIFPTYYKVNTKCKINKLSQISRFYIKQIDMVNSSASTIMLGPLVVFELLIIRILSLEIFANLRSNIICVLQKL